ncbi:MAG: hypothetical protein IJE04_03115 [Bacilli bacterium]|nr:hypothetical protein [Bacilli bacterium]
MEKNETKLTSEVYESIMDVLVRDIVELKKQQGEAISKVSIEKEALIYYKKILKQAKMNVKLSRDRLRTEKKNLRKINDTLNTRNNSITELNYVITLEEEKTIDLNEYSIEQTKRR